MSSSWKSRRNPRLTALLIALLAAFLLQTALSNFLVKSKPKIIQYLNSNFGCTFQLEDISFSFIKGVHLNGLYVFYHSKDNAVAYVKDAYLSMKLLPVFSGKLELGHAYISECMLLSRKEKDGINLQIIFSDIYKKMPQLGELSLYARQTKVVFVNDDYTPKGMEFWLKKTRVLMYPSGKTKFKSDIKFVYKYNKDNPLLRYINKDITQDLSCAMDGTIEGDNLEVNSLLLRFGEDEIIGTGLIMGYAERNPNIDIGFMATVLALADIQLLREDFNAFGYVSLSLRVKGALDSADVILSGNLYNCYLEYALAGQEAFKINNISGLIDYRNKFITLQNVSLKLNKLPLIIGLKTEISKDPEISAKVSLPKSFLVAQGLPLKKAEAAYKGKIKDKLRGNVEVKAVYTRKDSDSALQANLDNLEFDYNSPEEKYLKVSKVKLAKENSDNTQQLNFTDFSSMIDFSRDHIYIKNIRFAGYDGTVQGAVSIEFADKPNLDLFLNGRSLQIKELTRDMRLTNKFLSGRLDSKIEFNNYAKQFLKGDCFIKGGRIDLSALAEAVRLPSLEDTGFDILHVYFAVSKEMVKIRGVKLLSPNIKINAFWDIDKKINGVLNAKISTELLNNSPQFNRLLSISKFNKPFIDFRFLLGGTPKTIRTMWMKGEFKQKLEQGSAGWIKRRIESGMDQMIDDLSNR